MGREAVQIQVSSGNILEGDLYRRSPPTEGVGVLVLHPYAYLGGSMRDPVVIELFAHLCHCPWVSAVLRYNQRGVGTSTGYRQLRGSGDFLDVLDVADFLAECLPPSANKRLVVVGYSWGCCVAAHALQHPLMSAYVGVSFPLGGLSSVLGTRSHFAQLTDTLHVPRLIVMGSQDQFTAEAQIVQGVAAGGGVLLEDDDSCMPVGASKPLPPTPAGSAGPLALRLWEGADHFWMDQCSPMASYVAAWLHGTLIVPDNGSADAATAPAP